MRWMSRPAVCVVLFLALASGAAALSLASQSMSLTRYQNLTVDPLRLVFGGSLDTSTVMPASAYITDPDGSALALSYSFATTTHANDTLVLSVAPPPYRWPFARRLTIHVTSGVHGMDGSSFDGEFPAGPVFVANIPNDMDILQDWNRDDPSDFRAAFANANVLVGYNPVDPESTDPSHPELISGMGATEAWKVTAGRPDVLIAVVDTGVERYHYLELEENFFLNRGELPPPTIGGASCSPDPYDCNGDGKFNVRDYDQDPTFAGLGRPVAIEDLFDAFADGVDADGNGLVDDICGWDFIRNTNQALGVCDFPEGCHAQARARDAVGIADNGNDDKPGFCPGCSVLPVRVSDSVMTEANVLAAGIEYAHSMGARVAVFASESFNQSSAINQRFTELSEAGMMLVAVASDEDSYHHAYAGSFDSVLDVKAIFPLPPMDFYNVFPMQTAAFTETFCTMWGEHIHVAASSGECSSEAAGNMAGFAGLIYSRALDLGIDLTGNEVKEIITMSADDIKDHCLTFTGGTCQPGWDAHFGYGRPNAKNALAMLGDPETGAPERIPADVKFRAPAWFALIDPSKTPTVDVRGRVFARSRPFHWQLQVAVGKEPLDEKFQTVASGDGTDAIDGPLASVDVRNLFEAAALNLPPAESFDFTVTLRLQATYDQPGFGPVLGEDRRTIALHRDQDPGMGLLPGFPISMDASGRAGVTLYDLDGDPDGRLEIVATTSGPDGVTVLKYNAADGKYETMNGFPVGIKQLDGLPVATDATLSHPAVADLLGDGEPYIVVGTYQGAMLAIHRNGMAHLDENGQPAPLLKGFPVYADPPDNSTTKTWGHGRAFFSSPVLVDLDGDGLLEVVAGSFDGKIYAWKPVDLDGDGKADPVPGFPVLCKSDPGLVPDADVCQRDEQAYAPQITVSPAAGILDPDSDNPDIALHPSIVVGTSEACVEGKADLNKTTRLYAIYHDGMNNPSGSPFLSGFPVKLFGPLADVLPLPPVGIGITSIPALAHENGKSYIGVGSAIWFPEMVVMEGGKVTVQTLASAPGFNALAHGAFGRMLPGGPLHYVLPISSILDVIDNWISLLQPMLVGWSVDDLSHLAFSVKQHDCNWYLSAAIADINGDGLPEAVAGTGGFTVDAVDVFGRQPATWPKFTNQWSASSATIGDADGDGLMEVYQYTIEGTLFGWQTQGQACSDTGTAAEWWTSDHDERNTGTYGVDTQPPSVPTEFTVQQVAEGYRISFNAPGDDWKCGTPAAYDIRYAATRDELAGAARFSQAKPIPAASLPAVVPGGQAVSFTVPLFEPNLWFAMQTVDKVGNHSLVSEPESVGGGDDDDQGGGHGRHNGACGC